MVLLPNRDTRLRIVVATTNKGKIAELATLLPNEIELLTLVDVGRHPPLETGRSFLENASLKAHHAARSGYPALADDSGLEVNALNGAPGIHSARYSGDDANDTENNARLLENLALARSRDWTAKFRCAVVLALPDGREVAASGELAGKVVEERRGKFGFGYDPIFEVDDPTTPEENGKTLAEIEPVRKNLISHRARAYRDLAAECRKLANDDPVIRAIGTSPSQGS